MEIFKLPAVLPGTLDLVEINLKLKKGEIQLDWNAVISAPESALKILLDGIELEDKNLMPDEDGVSGQVSSQITTFFKNRDKKQTKKIVKNPEQASLFNVEYIAASQPEKQGSLIEQQFIINPNLTELNPPESPMVNPQSSIINPKSPYELRQELEEMIFNDLLGPAEGEDEEVDESSVTDRYLVGLLSPLIRNKTPEEQPEQQDEFVPAEKGNSEEGTTEGTIPPPNTMFPSSMGLTFCVDSDVKAIKITAKWGHYQREKSQYLTKKETSEPKLIWKRYPIQGTKIQPLKSGEIPEWTVDPEYPGVIVKGRMRRLDNQDWIVTLFLVNGQKEPAKQRDKAWLFQPELMIDSPDQNYSNIFVKKPVSIQQNLDSVIQLENQQMAMLYRHQVEFAVGHGVGVHAEIVPDNPTQASGLKTCMIPRYEVPQTTPPSVEEIPQLNGLILDMKTLAEAQPAEVPKLLTPLITAYQNWIQEQQQSLQDLLLNPDFLPSQNAAQTTLNHCQTTLDRIQEGIQLLTQNPQAVEAFQFMNEAMWRQRVHGIYAELKRQGKDPNLDEIDTPNNHSWRTFQLAFILLNLPALTDLHHPGRSHPLDAVCDLLWFPTGGGKTEAYLGLTAYTIGLRRLQGSIGGRDGEHGVAVLMRYTLRLLTLQQFQRATTLICACEVIRRQNPQKWGSEPFRIGLWVGNNSTPNYTSQSEEFVKQSKGRRSYPGLVITVYNWARPRDLSHYERFEHYHATFYQHVEALSVTPFASGALYRGLSALFVSLVRLCGDEFNQNDRPGLIQRNDPFIQAAINAIVHRAEAIEGVGKGQQVRQELEAKLDTWLNKAQTLAGGATLKYKVTSRDGTAINLLENAGQGQWQDFTCLGSLRNVEPTIGLILTDQPLDEERDRKPQPFE